MSFHHRLAHEDGWRISGDPNDEVTWIRPGGSPFIPGERDWLVAKSPIPVLEDFLLPEQLKDPEAPDTSQTHRRGTGRFDVTQAGVRSSAPRIDSLTTPRIVETESSCLRR